MASNRAILVHRLSVAALLLMVAEAGFADRMVDRDRARLQDRRSQILQSLRFELRQLSDECFENGQKQAAEDVTAISMKITSPSKTPELPELMQLPLGNRVPEADRVWRNRLRNLRSNRGQELYRLARSALKAGLPTLAYQLINDTLVVNPDHKYARSIVGQIPYVDETQKDNPLYAGEWLSPFEASKRSGRTPEVNHPEFGWLPVKHVSRYEQGERLYRGKWMSAVRETEIRRNFSNAWEIRTEHFLVKTNTSLEEGVEVSRKLERFHDWLTTHFPAFFDTPAALTKRFEQATVRSRSARTEKPMEVHYYASREEYDRVIRKRNPRYTTTGNGLYWEPDQTSYFFRKSSREDNDSTIYHEATHQILDLATIQDRINAARKRRMVLRQRTSEPWVLADRSNFWILEGIACYFESFEVHDGQVSVGRPDHIRFIAAQHRLLENNFYVPLRQFCSMKRDEFQYHANISQLYSQSSGLTHFLMEYNDGQYRDDLVTLLARIYRPDLKNILEEPSLERITGVPFETLDVQYREHMGDIAIFVAKKAQERQR